MKAPTRRQFLQSATLSAVAPVIIPASVLGAGARPVASNRITMGMIGLGSMGLRHVKAFLQENDCRILAVCDVDAGRCAAAVREINAGYGDRDCTAYNDFLEFIARDDIDTLCIAVPDHWHLLAATAGIRAGKDIYGEKPLTRTIREGRRLVREVRRYGCIWQTGSWQRSTAHFRLGCELVRNGRIGKVLRVETGLGYGFNPGSGRKGGLKEWPRDPSQPVPDGFDYQRWLGPAPYVPYTKERCHWNFRWILDYSGGNVTDFGAHHIDIVQWGLGRDHTGPVEIRGTGKYPADGLWDAAYDWDFTFRYADGLEVRAASTNHVAQGIKFIGEDGWVFINRSSLKTSDPRMMRERFGPDEIHLPRPAGDHRQGHRRDFLDCVKSRGETITPVEVGHRSGTICHLGNIAMETGRTIRWDPERETIKDDEGATRLLDRAYRAPWCI